MMEEAVTLSLSYSYEENRPNDTGLVRWLSETFEWRNLSGERGTSESFLPFKVDSVGK